MEKREILVFNVGSSSIRYSLFEEKKLICSGKFERLKSEDDYKKAVEEIFKKINPKKISFVIHRVVHGGELNHPVKITEEVEKKIKQVSELASLHNPKELMVIDFCKKYKKVQYAVFDTMFFSEIPDFRNIYAIPLDISKKYKIKRYGFHGLSHEYVSKNLKGKTIVCHLGSGVSISAIIDGKAVDTSMGFTPLEGIMMGTRSGTIDPGIIFFLQKRGYNVEKILTENSGFKGIAGYEDFRDIRAGFSKNEKCKLAYKMFVHQLVKSIGSYISVMNGLDNLIFTGAIGENVSLLRKDICKNFQYVKLKVDKEKNKKNSEIISSPNSKVKVFVKKTDEEKMALEKVLEILK